jgi:hypothetical protein
MIDVLQLFDWPAGWEQRVALAQLSARLPADRIRTRSAALGKPGSRPSSAADLTWLPARLGGSRLFAPALAAATLRGHLAQHPCDLLHAWSMPALAAASAALGDNIPLVTSVFDPGISNRYVNLLRIVTDRPRSAVLCASERVRRRLVERGVPYARCALVRPAIDFAAVRQVDAPALRARLGISETARLFTVAPQSIVDEGGLAALWAVLMRHHLDEPVCLAVSRRNRLATRITELADLSGCPQVVACAGDDVPSEALCVAADDLVIAETGEVSMTAVAWAMAGGTRVSAAATYATTEMLTDGVNARLFKAPAEWRRRAARLARLFDPDTEAARRAEAARGQAYEVFSLRRCVREHIRVYENLRADQPPGEGLSDPALANRG